MINLKIEQEDYYTDEESLAIENSTLTTTREFLTKRRIPLEFSESIEKLAKALAKCGEKREITEQRDGKLLLKQLYLKIATIDIFDLMTEY